MLLNEEISNYLRLPSLVSEEDLIALVVAPSCSGGINPRELAAAVVNRYGAGSSRNWYDALYLHDLLQIPGMNKARAAAVAAVATLAERIAAKTPKYCPEYDSSEKIYRLFSDLSYIDREEFHVLYLDAKLQMIARRQIAIGSTSACPVDSKEVFSWAMRYRATALALIHNHPSGDPAPSMSDLNLTRRFQKIGDIINCRVHDHIVIGRDGAYYSFFDHDDM